MHALGEPGTCGGIRPKEDKDLELVFNKCWATPSPDPHDVLGWNLLYRGYINMFLFFVIFRFYPFIAYLAHAIMH